MLRITDTTRFLFGAAIFFVLPTLARFLLRHGFRRNALWDILDRFPWLFYILGVLFVAGALREYASGRGHE